jgi:P-type Ca2+ transporter type 2C
MVYFFVNTDTLKTENCRMSEPIASQNKENAKYEWHMLEIKDVFKHLTSQQEGLSSEEASRRLTQYGPNELQAAHRTTPWEILVEQFKNVLIIILLIATVFAAFLGEGLDAIVIAVIVLFAVGLGFIQEYRAERAIEALRQMAAPTAAVMRDGEEIEIPAREVVPAILYCYARGIKYRQMRDWSKSINLQVEEAALTGESVPVEKHAKPIGK